MISITRSIRGKIVIYVYTSLVVIIGALLYVFINGTYKVLIQDSEQILRLSLIDVAEELNQSNHHAIVVARTMAEAQQSGLFGERLNSIGLVKSILAHNPEFTGAYICYEPNADGGDKSHLGNSALPKSAVDSTGRFLPTWIRSLKKPDSISLHCALYMENSLYYEALKRRHNSPDSAEFIPSNLEISSMYRKVESQESRKHSYMVTEPYMYEGKLMVEHTYPIIINSEFKGIAGIDKTLSEIRLLLLEKKRHKTENFILISRMGRIITSTLPNIPSTQILENTVYGSILKDLFLVKEHDSTIVIRTENPVSKSSSYFTSTFLESGHWVVVSIVDEDEILAPVQEQLQISIIISIIGMLALLPVLIWIAKSITRPIAFVRESALQISDGNLDIKIPSKYINADTENVLSALIDMGKAHRDELLVRQLIASITAKFVDINHNSLNQTIVEALKELGEFIGADRAYIIRFDESRNSVTFTHTWDESGIQFRIALNQEYPESAIPFLIKSLRIGKPVSVSSVHELPPEAKAERELMIKAEAKSSIMVPLKLAGELYGGMLFHAMLEAQEWQEKHFELLALTGGVFLNAINRLNREEAIRTMNIVLEERVKARTSELQEANRELEAFSYSVSHDLRTPLRHIDGFTELLFARIHEQLDEKDLNYLHRIGNASKYMGRLIDDLLMFSRMGKTELVTSRVDTNRLVNDVLKELGDQSKERSIDLQVESLPVVMGDAAMLRLVFVNLITNAIKFTSKELNAEIRVSCAEENSEFVFSVKDNGVGFDPDYGHKLFGVFERLHSQEEFEGTGIGLANIKRIIVRHKGRVWAEGEVNKGASFYFSLPQESEEPKNDS
jgi:signal transduction histidine kinase